MIMEILIYICIFIIGAYIGSFASLATYRIPLKEDILIKHSYCPVCKEKLTIKDLIPIFSYIFLRGRCSHCGEKIKIRYLVLEVTSGILFLLFIMSLKIDISNINIQQMIFLLIITTFFVTLVLIAGIDKETKTIHKSVILFGIIVVAIYNIYVFYFKSEGMHLLIETSVAIILYVISQYCIKSEKIKYIINFIILMLLTSVFSNEYIVLFGLALTIITSILHKWIAKTKVPIGCYYIIYFASIFIGSNFLIYPASAFIG